MGERQGKQRAVDLAEWRLDFPVGRDDLRGRLAGVIHHRKRQRSVGGEAGHGGPMGAGHHNINGQDRVELRQR